MRIHIYILLLLFSLFSKAQNLVPNNSFETYTICPNNNDQIESAIPWTAATATSSTDYFNACSLNEFNVPNCAHGFQNAHSGSAFAGLFFYLGSGQREYLQVQLSSPLTQSTTYYIEFYVNLLNTNWNSGCNNIAANLSVTRPYTTTLGVLQPLTAHILLAGNPIITDTLNWVRISGCYTAMGGEEYITIGNFFNNLNTQGGTSTLSYYFIEDVKVEAITGSCVTNVNELASNNYIKVYPNPNNGIFNIAYTFNQAIHTFELYDLMGKKVNEKMLNGNEDVESINLSNINHGIYFYKVIDADGKMLVSGKLIIN